jgi:hypothetical protein
VADVGQELHAQMIELPQAPVGALELARSLAHLPLEL